MKFKYAIVSDADVDTVWQSRDKLSIETAWVETLQ